MEIKNVDSRHTATIRVQHVDDVGKALGDILPAIFGHLGSLGIQPDYPPFARFHGGTMGDWDMEAGVGVASPISDSGRIKASTLPGGRALVEDHYGPYDKLHGVWMKLRESADQKGLKSSSPPWETYWTDPNEAKDPSELRTELIYPIV